MIDSQHKTETKSSHRKTNLLGSLHEGLVVGETKVVVRTEVDDGLLLLLNANLITLTHAHAKYENGLHEASCLFPKRNDISTGSSTEKTSQCTKSIAPHDASTIIERGKSQRVHTC